MKLNNQTYKFEDFEIDLQKPLGSGYISKVYKAVHKTNRQTYAIDLTRVLDDERQALSREIDLQKKLQHPNIVKLYDSFQQFLENGNLWERLKKLSMNDPEIQKILMQVVSAVEYLHQRRIIHRDIKPENILLDENFNIKLCDFGFCAPYGDGILRKTICGTQEYIPPEILSKDTQDNKVDIWCLGILLYEMVHKRTPFQGLQMRNMKELQKKIKIQFNENINSKFKKIIKMCLQFEPYLRPNATEILDILRDNRVRKQRKTKQNVQIKNNININIANLNINFGFKKKQYEENIDESKRDRSIQKVIKYSVNSQNSIQQFGNRIRKITYSVPKKPLEDHMNIVPQQKKKLNQSRLIIVRNSKKYLSTKLVQIVIKVLSQLTTKINIKLKKIQFQLTLEIEKR